MQVSVMVHLPLKTAAATHTELWAGGRSNYRWLLPTSGAHGLSGILRPSCCQAPRQKKHKASSGHESILSLKL